ncbi:hypothetical protein G4W71_08965 [Clostridium botulinum]|nr:hypothetical protein [Clostridium botulinum]MBE1304149.1 hypothetical protein [Clostridium botulinum]
MLINKDIIKMFLFVSRVLYIIFRDAKSILKILSTAATTYSIVILLLQ